MSATNPERMIKSAISQAIVEEMLKELGFYVMRFGKEITVNPLTQMKSFISSCGGSLDLETEDKEDLEDVMPVSYINKLPDFVIVSKKGTVDFVEVKYRHNADLWKNDIKVFTTFPRAMLVVVNNTVTDYLFKDLPHRTHGETVKGYDKELVKTRFHVWSLDEEQSEDKINTTVATLKDYLKSVFGIENDSVIAKYESLVKVWIPERLKTSV